MVCFVFEDHIYLLWRVDAGTDITSFHVKWSITKLNNEIEKCIALWGICIFSLSFLQVKCFLLRWLCPIWHQVICSLPCSALLWTLGDWLDSCGLHHLTPLLRLVYRVTGPIGSSAGQQTAREKGHYEYSYCISSMLWHLPLVAAEFVTDYKSHRETPPPWQTGLHSNGVWWLLLTEGVRDCPVQNVRHSLVPARLVSCWHIINLIFVYMYVFNSWFRRCKLSNSSIYQLILSTHLTEEFYNKDPPFFLFICLGCGGIRKGSHQWTFKVNIQARNIFDDHLSSMTWGLQDILNWISPYLWFWSSKSI